MTRVVITGMGAISSIGHSVDDFWKNCINGVSGTKELKFDWRYKREEQYKQKNAEYDDYVKRKEKGELTEAEKQNTPALLDPPFYSLVCAPVENFDVFRGRVEKKELRKLDPGVLYALAATREALESSKLKVELLNKKENSYIIKNIDPRDIGVVFGSGDGGTNSRMLNHTKYLNYEKENKFTVSMSMLNGPASWIAIKYNAKGPNVGIVTACASSTHAIGEAYEKIKHDWSKIIITGGCDACLNDGDGYTYHGFDTLLALSKRNDAPEKASRPFDKNRDGFVMGEGAGVLILESLEHAKSRGAPIFAEIIGYYANSDAFSIMEPDPSGESIAEMMRRCIKNAGLTPKDIDYINAHGTSTPPNDKTETIAIKKALGERANDILINSTKSMIGHGIGAGGGLEAIATIKSLQTGIIHPTINYETPDPECDLNYVPNVAVERQIKHALSNSYGFGGHNGCILLKKWYD